MGAGSFSLDQKLPCCKPEGFRGIFLSHGGNPYRLEENRARERNRAKGEKCLGNVF